MDSCSTAPTGACETDHLLGVQIAANIGASLKVEASEIGDESDPFLSLTIAVRTLKFLYMLTLPLSKSNNAR
jgi:hypothetical protein